MRSLHQSAFLEKSTSGCGKEPCLDYYFVTAKSSTVTPSPARGEGTCRHYLEQSRRLARELMSIVVFRNLSGGDFLAVFRHSVFELNAGNHICQTFCSFQFPPPALRAFGQHEDDGQHALA
jgi:hypothetical protein